MWTAYNGTKAHALVPLFFDGRNARALLPPLLFDFLVESNSSAVMGETLALQSHRRFGRIFRWERTSRFNPIAVRPDFSMGENLALQPHHRLGGIFSMGLNMLPSVEENLKFWASPTSRMGANTLPFSNARRQL